jgi:hypothetical protein
MYRKTEQEGPPLPGDYCGLRYNAPVAVCILNSSYIATELRVIAQRVFGTSVAVYIANS